MTWQPPLETLAPWRGEAERAALTTATDYYSAFNEEIVRYLRAGDCRPLVDLIISSERAPGSEATKFIGAMLAPDQHSLTIEDCPFRFGFEERRLRGRPRKGQTNINRDNVYSVLIKGINLILKATNPDKDFWRYLVYGITANESNAIINPHLERSDELNSFPVIIGVISKDGRAGRRKDPELETNQRLLAERVQDHIKMGEPYKVALHNVAEEVRTHGEIEGWSASHLQFERKIRQAYDRHAKTLHQNGR